MSYIAFLFVSCGKPLGVLRTLIFQIILSRIDKYSQGAMLRRKITRTDNNDRPGMAIGGIAPAKKRSQYKMVN